MRGPRSILLTSYSGQFAGMEIRMIQEARLLKSAGWRVTVATRNLDGRDKLEAALAGLGVPLLHFEPPPFLSDWPVRHRNWLRAMVARPPWLNPGHFDLVHVFMPWTHRGQEHVWMAARAGIPVVISAHNAFTPPAETPWHRWHLTRAFRRVRGLYGVSQAALTMFQQGFSPYIPETAVQSIIYNFVDTERFLPDPEAGTLLRAQLGLKAHQPIVGTVGRLSAHKQPVEILRVFKLVQRAIPDAHCIFVGEGLLLADVEAAIGEMGLRDCVSLMGFQEDPSRILAGLDVHLLLSRVEGFGIATAEAMACAVPVVATRVPGSEEVVDDGVSGRLVPLDDLDAAAGAIIDLLANDELRRTMGRAGRARAQSLFSRHIWENNIQAFYHRVLE